MTPDFDEVIVCSLVPYGETDLVVRLFSRERGRVGAFARSARRSKRRFGGSLQPLARGRAKLSPRGAGELFRLESLEAEPGLFGVAQDPLTFGRASYLVEVTDRLLPEEEPAPAVFELLETALRAFERGRGDVRVMRAFELKLLFETGYLPDLLLFDERTLYVDPSRGDLSLEERPGSAPLPLRAREAAQALFESPLDRLPEVDEETLRIAGRIFAVHLRRLGVRDLKSVAFLKAL